ncbi:hypothetical protein Btru_035045 [Bulinus truncatus]|nr:hypothetical protein Btru_035045 [Bulinus truncatus]
MTKVRSILSEFCSPKDILAINRLGLIKNDDRDTQPVPWRHRLPNSERRQLVMNEMRTAIRTTNRINPKDKEKAIATARNVIDSKMGECLLNVHSREDPALKPSLTHLGREQIRRDHGLQQTKLRFLRQSQCLNREPMILVERAPTFHAVTRATFMTSYGFDPEAAHLPSYMRPLQSRSRTPSTLTTIEAFTAENKKKKNIWDEALEETPKFKSIAKPSARLTDEEVEQLRAGRQLHKPTAQKIAVMKVTKAPRLSRSKTMGSVFITQLPRDVATSKSEGKLDAKPRLNRSERSNVHTQEADADNGTSSAGIVKKTSFLLS